MKNSNQAKKININQLITSLEEYANNNSNLDDYNLFNLVRDLKNNIPALDKESMLRLVKIAKFLPNFDYIIFSEAIKNISFQFELNEINIVFSYLKDNNKISKFILASIIKPLAEESQDKLASATSSNEIIENFLLLAQLKHRDFNYYKKWRVESQSFNKEIYAADAIKIIQSITSLNFRDDAIIEKLYEVETTNILERNILKLFYLSQYYVLNQDMSAGFKNQLYNYIITETKKINLNDISGEKSQTQFLQIYTAFERDLKSNFSEENIELLVEAVKSTKSIKTTDTQIKLQRFLEEKLNYLNLRIEAEKYVLIFSPSDMLIADKKNNIIGVVEVDGFDHNYINDIGTILHGHPAEPDAHTKFRNFLLDQKLAGKKLIVINANELITEKYQAIMAKVVEILPQDLILDATKALLPEGKMASQLPKIEEGSNQPVRRKERKEEPQKNENKADSKGKGPKKKGQQRKEDDDDLDTILRKVKEEYLIEAKNLSVEEIARTIKNFLKSSKSNFDIDVINAINNANYSRVKLSELELYKLSNKIHSLLKKERNPEKIKEIVSSINKIISATENEEVKRNLINESLFNYIKDVKFNLLEDLITQFQPNLDVLDSEDYALLQHAVDNFKLKPEAKEDVLKIIQILLDNGADPDIISIVNKKQVVGKPGYRYASQSALTPLSQIVGFEDKELFDFFFKYNPSLRIRLSSEGEGAAAGGTILHLAALRHNKKILEDLLKANQATKQLDINEVSEECPAVLFNYIICMLKGSKQLDMEKVKILLDYGADINSVIKEGNTILHILLRYAGGLSGVFNQNGQRESFATAILKLLIEYGKKSVKNIRFDIQNQEGTTILMDAVKADNAEFLKILIKLPDIGLNLYDKDGNTAITIAALYRNKNAFKLLANLPEIDMHIPNNDLLTAYFLLGFIGDPDNQKELLPKYEPSPLMLEFWNIFTGVMEVHKNEIEELIIQAYEKKRLPGLKQLVDNYEQYFSVEQKGELKFILSKLQQEKEENYPRFEYRSENDCLPDKKEGPHIGIEFKQDSSDEGESLEATPEKSLIFNAPSDADGKPGPIFCIIDSDNPETTKYLVEYTENIAKGIYYTFSEVKGSYVKLALLGNGDSSKSIHVVSQTASQTQQVLKFYPTLKYFGNIFKIVLPDINLSTEGKALMDFSLGIIKIYGNSDLILGQIFESSLYYSGLKVTELLYQKPVEEKITNLTSLVKVCAPAMLISAATNAASLSPIQVMHGAVYGASGCLNKHKISAVETSLESFARVTMDIAIGAVTAYFNPGDFFSKAMIFISSAVSTDICVHLVHDLYLVKLQGEMNDTTLASDL